MNATAAIVRALKLTPLTYAEMMCAGRGRILSTSPQKRVAEWLSSAEGQKWELRKSKRLVCGRYLTTWRIVRRRACKT